MGVVTIAAPIPPVGAVMVVPGFAAAPGAFVGLELVKAITGARRPISALGSVGAGTGGGPTAAGVGGDTCGTGGFGGGGGGDTSSLAILAPAGVGGGATATFSL